MSDTNNTVREWRDETSSSRRSYLGMLRRMAVKLTEGATWQVIGHLLLDNRTKEIRDAELFGGGLGFYSRPAAGANAEAIVINRDGGDPIIIATRDEELRATVANLGQGQTAMCNRATIILCKPDGTVEIRLPGGTALSLPTLADHNALRSAFNAHTHVVAGVTAGGASVVSAVPASTVGSPSGTAVLKAQ